MGLRRKRKSLQEERLNGPGEREFWEKGKATSQLFTIITFEIFFFYRFTEKSNLKTIKRRQNLATDFFRGIPLSLAHVTYD